LILFISLVGLKTESVAEGLTVKAQLPKAFLLAASVTAIRFLLDIFIWRLDANAAAAIRARAYAAGRIVAAIGIALGGFLFLFSGLRTSLVEKAANIYWLLGTAVDLATFGAMAAFALFLAMAAIRAARWALNRTGGVDADHENGFW